MARAQSATARDSRGGRGVGRWLLNPAIVVVAALATYLWVSSRELGEPEQRNLNTSRLLEAATDHLELTAWSAVLTILIAVPLGVLLTRPGISRLAPVALGLANVGQGAPVIGVIVLLSLLTGEVGKLIAVVAIVAYSVLPVLRNTMVGIQGVDRNTLDAAKGLGMSRGQVLWRCELPLAVPVILAGVRTALILIVGVATLATFINGGGAGDLINTGLKLQRVTVLVSGAVLAASIALTVDWIAAVVETKLTPRGLRLQASE